jgi:hypothetical protein
VVAAWFENRVVAWAGLVVGALMMVFGGPLVARSLAIAGGDGIPGYYQVTGEPDCRAGTSRGPTGCSCRA